MAINIHFNGYIYKIKTQYFESILDHENTFARHACLLNVTLDIRYLVNSFLAWMAGTFMLYMTPKYNICIKIHTSTYKCVQKYEKQKYSGPDNKQ